MSRPPHFHPELAQGRLLVHTGDGKGKSTAAYGTAIRAFGHRQQHGKKVGIFQFIKDDVFPYGELSVLRDIGIELHALGDGCSLRGQDPEGSRQLAVAGWQRVRTAILSGEYFLLVLDELTLPLHFGWLNEADVLQTLKDRPADSNILITGRYCPAALMDLADSVSISEQHKHIYEQGVLAQRGIEN